VVGAEKAVNQFEKDAFTHAGRPEQDARLPRGYCEADIFKNLLARKSDGDVMKSDYGTVVRRGLGERRGLVHSGGKSASSTLVTRKSTRLMLTEALTTA
jgi:hypothetical protein